VLLDTLLVDDSDMKVQKNKIQPNRRPARYFYKTVGKSKELLHNLEPDFDYIILIFRMNILILIGKINFNKVKIIQIYIIIFFIYRYSGQTLFSTF
jgi:hypothetical protein